MQRELPLVTIICPTYNHEKYLAQALEGFISQKTNFPIEIIVHDDASSDSTVDIAKEYEKKFPQLFNNIYQVENQLSQGIDRVTKITFKAARGKYLALCEGDDYWTDPNKLQKQVDFLEANLDYAICYHAVTTLENGIQRPSELNFSDEEQTYSILDLADINLINTASVVFRNGLIEKFPDWFGTSPIGDYVLHFLNAKKGLIKYFPGVMSVYRRHPNGIWSGLQLSTMLRKYINVLDLLISEDFGQAVANRLFLQKRKHVEEYLNVLVKEDNWSEFLKELEIFSEADCYIAKKWLLEYYPAQINSLKSHIGNVVSTRSFKLSKKVSAVYQHLKNFLLVK